MRAFHPSQKAQLRSLDTNSLFSDIVICCLTKNIFIIPIVVSFVIRWNPGATCLYLWPKGITLYLIWNELAYFARVISSPGLYEWTLHRGNIFFKLYNLLFDYKFIFNSNTKDVFNSVKISCLQAAKCNRVFLKLIKIDQFFSNNSYVQAFCHVLFSL